MNKKVKSFLLWVFVFIFTAVVAVYQRMTGPSYEIRGKVMINEQLIKYKLIRTWDGGHDAYMFFNIPDQSVTGEIKFRRFKSYDKWSVKPLKRAGNNLIAFVPHQPPAGKVMYQITLTRGEQQFLLNEEPAIMRYKGFVPNIALIPHIFFIFLAMMFSTRTGLEALFKGKYTYLYTWFTIITLFLGGLILGPVVQKFSFGVYWSGWPFGHDLTDNKSLVAFIFWVIALIVLAKNREKKFWPVLASVVMLIIFLIPHSVLGSEIDFTREQKTEVTR